MPDSFNVTSHNQKGGITAGQVNFGKQDRRLTPELTLHLKNLPRDETKPLLIIRASEDAETLRFSDLIKNFFVSLGHANISQLHEVRKYAKNVLQADVGIVLDEDKHLKEIIVSSQK